MTQTSHFCRIWHTGSPTNLSSLRIFEIEFESGDRYSRTYDEECLTFQKLLDIKHTPIQIARESEWVLSEMFAGWRLEKTLQLQAWNFVRSDDDDDDDDDSQLEAIQEVRDDDKFDEAVVHEVVLLSTKT